MKKNKIIDVTKVEWSHPMGLKELSRVFDVHRATMSKWLKDQVILNRRLSLRRWEVAISELPYNIKEDKTSNIV